MIQVPKVIRGFGRVHLNLFCTHKLYQRTIKGLFLKCLDFDETIVAMGDTHVIKGVLLRWLLQITLQIWLNELMTWLCQVQYFD